MPKKSLGRPAYERVHRIEQRLKSHCPPTLDELADEFAVSKRTIERDIEWLRDYWNASLEYDRRHGTYRLTDPGFSLPAVMLTHEELAALLFADRAIRQYKDMPFNVSEDNSVAHKALNKVVSHLMHDSKEAERLKELCNAIVFESAGPFSAYKPNTFKMLIEAIVNRESMDMTYCSLSGGKTALRRVNPYHVVNWSGDWYLIGYCHKNKEVRNFHLARIEDLKETDAFFDIPASFNVHAYMATGFGRMTGGKAKKVKIHVLPPASQWVKEKIWHSSQVLAEHGNGSVDITLEVSNMDAVKRWVLQFGAQAELLEPVSLRNEIKTELAETNKKYC